MRDFLTIKENVRDTLMQHPDARNSDTLLYMYVCERMNPVVRNLAFTTVLARRSELGIPKSESVRRARQLLQAEDETLRASKAVDDARFENFKFMREAIHE